MGLPSAVNVDALLGATAEKPGAVVLAAQLGGALLPAPPLLPKLLPRPPLVLLPGSKRFSVPPLSAGAPLPLSPLAPPPSCGSPPLPCEPVAGLSLPWVPLPGAPQGVCAGGVSGGQNQPRQ